MKRNTTATRALSILSIAIGALLLSVNTVQAQITDEASLRAAIISANNSPIPSVITISATGRIVLTSPLPPILADVVIEGPGAGDLTIDGANAYRVFHAGNGSTEINVTIRGLTVANGAGVGGSGGSSAHGGGGGGGAGLGGGLFVDSRVNMTLTDVRFDGNQAIGGAGGSRTEIGSSGGGGGGGGFGGDGGTTIGGHFSGSGGGGLINSGNSPTSSTGGAGASDGGGAGGDYSGSTAGNAGGWYGGGGGGGTRGQGGAGGRYGGGGGGGDAALGGGDGASGAAGGAGGFGGGAGGWGDLGFGVGNGNGGSGYGGAVFVADNAQITITNVDIGFDNSVTGGAGAVNGSAAGSGIFVRDGVRLNVNVQNGEHTLGSALASEGADRGLRKTGNGTLAMDASNSLAGGLTVEGGFVAYNNDSQINASAGVTLNGGGLQARASFVSAANIVLGTNGGIIDTRDFDLTLSGSLNGNGSLEKTGNGALVLTGDSLSGGQTVVNRGLLQVGTASNTHATVNGSVVVRNGARLGGTGTINGDVEIGAGGTLTPGVGVGTLTTGNLTLDSSSFLNFEFGGAGVSDRVDVNGNLILDGTLNVTNVGGFGVGLYRLFNYTGQLTDRGLEIGTSPIARDYLSVQTSQPNQVNLLYETLPFTFWAGGNGTWSATDTSWKDRAGALGTVQANEFAIFSGNPGTVTVSTAGGAVETGGMQFATNGYRVDGDDLTLSGATTARVGDGTSAGAGMTTIINNALIGAGSLDKTDLGKLVLTGNSLYSGGTTVSAGILQIGTTSDSDASIMGAVTVGNGATLAGTGTIDGTVTIGAGGTLTPGASIGTLTTGSLALDSSSNLNFEFGGAGINDRVVVNGNLTLDGTLNVSDVGGFGPGSYRLFDYSGLLFDRGLVLGSTPVDRRLLSVQTSIAQQVNLLYSSIPLTTWRGGDGTWSGSDTFTIFQGQRGTITVDGTIRTNGIQFASDGFVLNGGTIVLDDAQTTIRVGDGSAAGSTMTATINSTLTGNGGLRKTDLGTLVLNGDNSYTGETVIDSGTLRMGSDTALGLNPTVTVNESGTLDINGHTLRVGQTNGTGTVMLGGGNFVIGVGDTSSTLATRLTGNGTLTKTGSGTLIVTGNNTYTGATRIDGGVLVAGSDQSLGISTTLSISGGASLDLNNHSHTVGSLEGAGAISLGNATLTIGTNNANSTFSGGISGRGSIAKTGSGELTLSGDNDFTGATIISGGTLTVGSQGALRSTNGVFVAGRSTFNLNGFDQTFTSISGAGNIALGNATLTLGANDTSSTLSASVSGTGKLKKVGAGVLMLDGANTYSGGTIVEAGALAGNTSSLQGAITNNSFVAFDQTTDGTYAGRMSGSGGLIKEGEGVLTLTGENSYQGGTLITKGTIVGTTKALHGIVFNDAALTIDQNFDDTFDGIISGTGVFNKTGSGSLTLTGDHPITGTTTVESGALVLEGSLGGSVSVMSAAKFTGSGLIGGSLKVDSGARGSVPVNGDRAISSSAEGPRPQWATASADVRATVGALGHLVVGGDVTLSAGSAYEFGMNGSGESAVLAAAGTIRATGVELQIASGEAAFPRVMQTALMTAEGGIVGEPTVRADRSSLDTFLKNDGHTLFLTVINNDVPLAATAATKNGAAVAGAIDQQRSRARGDLAIVTRELAALDDYSLAAGLDQLSGEVHSTAIRLSVLDGESTTDVVRSEAAARGDDESRAIASSHGRRFWGRMLGQRASLDGHANAHGASGYTGGFLIGADWAKGDAWLFGGGGGYGMGELSMQGTTDRAELTAPRAFGYASYGRGRTTVRAGSSMTWTSYRTGRSMAFTARLDPRFGNAPLFGGVNRQAESTVRGLNTDAWFDATVTSHPGGWLLQPAIGMRAANYGRNAWTETGASSLSLAAPDQSINSMQADARLGLSRVSGAIRPFAVATYRRELGYGATTTALRLADADGLFTTHGVSLERSRWIGEAGLTVGSGMTFGYRIDAGRDQVRQSLDVGVRFE